MTPNKHKGTNDRSFNSSTLAQISSGFSTFPAGVEAAATGGFQAATVQYRRSSTNRPVHVSHLAPASRDLGTSEPAPQPLLDGLGLELWK